MKKLSLGSSFYASVSTAIMFLWLMTSVFMAFSLPWVPRLVEGLLVWTVLVGLLFGKRGVTVFEYGFIAGLICLIVIVSIFDSQTWYYEILYLKTLSYVVICSLGGLVYSRLIFCRENVRITSCTLAWCSLLCIFFIFGWCLFLLGWWPGQTLLGTALGIHYQGLSRTVAMCALLLVCAKRHIPFLLLLLGLFFAAVLVVGFNSMGALFGFFVAGVYYFFGTVRKISYGPILGWLFLLLMGLLFLGNMDSVTSDTLANFISRLTEKISVFNVGGGENRLWLMSQGLELWLKDVYSMLFGFGALNYACEVGYCDSYRHPHNFIVLLLIWFGVFALPLIVALGYLFLYAMKFIVSQKYNSIVAAVFLYLLLLSFVGGDIEQNRHFMFFSFALWGVIRAHLQERRVGQETETLLLKNGQS